MKRVFEIPAKTHGIGNIVFKWQKKSSNLLASSGSNRSVFIFDRKGNAVSEFSLPGKCTGMEWDNNGEHLAIIHDQSSSVFLWNTSDKGATEVDVGLKGFGSMVCWSPEGKQFIVGNNKGDISVYSVPTQRKLPLLGKHRKRIVSADWGRNNKFVVASADQTLTINTPEGDAIANPQLGGDPSLVKTFDGNDEDDAKSQVAVVMNSKTLLLFHYDNPNRPAELSFHAKYGSIVSYEWFGNGKILIGFSSGFFVVMNTDNSEAIGFEEHHSRNHRTRLTDVAVSNALGKIATCGDSQVKIMDMEVYSEIFSIIDLDDDSGLLDKLNWSEDGQLLSVSTENGSLYTYLTKLPVVGSASDHNVACLSALQELSITNDENHVTRVKLPVEPSSVGVHEHYTACAMNNSAWFYSLAPEGAELLPDSPRTYTSSIKSIHLAGEFAAVHCGKKVQLHLIETMDEDMPNTEKMFPTKSSEVVADVALTMNFLIYVTVDGTIYYFSVEDWSYVNEFKHICGINQVFADSSGVRVVVLDAKGDALLYSPVDDSMLNVPKLPVSAKGVVFDISPEDPTFVVYDDEYVYTYIEHTDHIKGPHVEFISKTRLMHSHVPIRLDDGVVTNLTAAGKVSKLTLSTHKNVIPGNVGDSSLQSAIESNMRIRRHQTCFILLKRLQRKNETAAAPLFEKVGQACLDCLEFEYAIHIYRLGGNAKMVEALSGIRYIEDRNLLAGHVHLFAGNHSQAEQLFLKSSQPEEALNLHRDLLHWEEALDLAHKFSKKDIPVLSREFALELEHQGNYTKALDLYTAALSSDVSDRHHVSVCKGGLARACIGSGDIRRGAALARELNQKSIYRECGQILEKMHQLGDAAEMYEKGSLFDKAASIYIQAKDWRKVGTLLQNITSPRLHTLYAKSREDDGSYKEASAAYEKAHDYISVIRINLDHLRNPDKAVQIVKETGSVEGAKMVAEFFIKMNDFPSAVQFLVLSGAHKEAFKMAKQHNQLTVYAQVLEETGGNVDDYRQIAVSFDEVNHPLEAGKFYAKAGDFGTAVDKLMDASNADNAHIELLVDTVGLAKDEALTQKVINFLLGASDGVPKDSTFLLRLYMATEQFTAASKTALTIARDERTTGSYRNAHDVLFNLYAELFTRKHTIPSELIEDLVVLHSYILGKIHLRRGDHLKAGRMLLRVAENVSKFPAHVINILTSTVIECFRSGMRQSAFTHAATLMKPEYKPKLDAKYSKRIETIVRKKDLSEVEEETSPCPYCSVALKDSALSCFSCEHRLPMCCASGYFVTTSSIVVCKNCNSPARESEINALLTTEDKCPMCYVPTTSFVQVEDVPAFFTNYKEVFTKSKPILTEEKDEYIEVEGDDDDDGEDNDEDEDDDDDIADF
eukprot:m.128120 g.128120  ORF g.128120 m.128120 type:complete len:1383 (-) comp9449_c2_seq5:5705-9853(-)